MAKKSEFRELPLDQLRWRCDPERLGFESTKDLEACQEIIGQPRATEAIRVGLEIGGFGYNIFVTGLVGTGRNTTIKRLLQEIDTTNRIPEDLCYLNNFRNPDMPRAIALSAGQGIALKRDMENLIESLKRNIPLIFESEMYQKKRKEALKRLQANQVNFWRQFEKEVKASGFSLVQFKMGPYSRPGILPLVDGKPIDLSELEVRRDAKKLGDEDLEKVKGRHKELTEMLEKLLKEARKNEREIEQALSNLNREAVLPLVREMISDIREKYDYPKVRKYLDEVQDAILANLGRFQEVEEKRTEDLRFLPGSSADPFLEFRVNVLVDNAETQGAPIVIENFPTYRNLFGTLERVVGPSGLWRTDFTRIKAGSLIRANGGYLLLNALDALIEPGVWTTLKRTLKNGVIEIQTYDPLYLIGGTRFGRYNTAAP